MADADTRRMAVNEVRVRAGLPHVLNSRCSPPSAVQLRIARAAKGEHLIRFVDAFFDEGKISIALEFADAGSMDDIIRCRAMYCVVPQYGCCRATVRYRATVW